MVESSDKMWSTGEGNGKPLQYSCLVNPMNSMKKQKDRVLKGGLPRLVGAQMLLEKSGEINPERMKRSSQSKNNTQLWINPVVTGDGSEVQCCKEQYCIGTWNVRSMNQGQLKVVKQEVARLNIDILGISELKGTGMENLIHVTIISTTVGKNPLEEME